MQIYDTITGYFNAEEIIRSRFYFIFVTGARGTGKTFSTIKDLIEKKENFIFLRRTQNEADLQSGDGKASDIGKVLKYVGSKYEFHQVHKNINVCTYNGGKIAIAALSTFASIRGLDFSDYDYIVYDEFITEPHVRALKAEGFALQNLYESVNRNRELEGKKPVKLICLSNSLNIANDIFIAWDLISQAEELSNAPDDQMIYTRKDTLLIIMKNSPISDLKAQTILYQNASEEFSAMALNNQFILNDFTYVQENVNLKDYRILYQVGNLYAYRHKSEKLYYVTFKRASVPKDRIYRATIADLQRFRRAELRHFQYYLDGFYRFQNYKCIALFEKYFKP